METTVRLRAVTRGARTVTVLTIVTLFLGLAGLSVAGHDDHSATPSPEASQCVSASPRATHDAASSPVASPDATVSTVGPGTPVSISCLTVTLTLDNAAAGPRTITVEVVGQTGAPVTDAEVVLNTRSLVMDHGTSTNQASPTEPGHYVIQKVPMGMGGAWQAEIVITRPGQAPVTVIFTVELEGPA